MAGSIKRLILIEKEGVKLLTIFIRTIKAILYIVAIIVLTFYLMLMVSMLLFEVQPTITATVLILILSSMLSWEFRDVDLLRGLDEFMRKY